MKYVIQKEQGRAAYLQLYGQVRTDIVTGVYPFGAKLPSKRTVADETGISTVTVEHAYALLSDEGYVEARERRGYFVIFRPTDGFAVPNEGTHAPLFTKQAYSTEDRTDFPFSVLAKAMRGVLASRSEAILLRSPNAGCNELRDAIRCYLERSRGIVAETRQIVIGSGAEYLYTLLVAMLGRERVYGIESPSYAKIEEVYRASDVDYEPLRLGRDGIESAALWASRANILHITPYRSFPSGVTATASKRHEYLRWAEDDDRYIVEDDFESEFSVSKKPEETLFSHATRDNVIYMNSFSRTVSPSLRVAYAVLPNTLLPVFEKRLGFLSCTVPTYIQLVLSELIANGSFERHINRTRRQKRRALANEE